MMSEEPQDDANRLEVSVVAATYRRARRLEELLASLAAQSLPRERFEVVVVDDGSGDETLERLEAWRRRGELQLCFATQENSGPAAARNRGFRMAAAPLIAFTDDDCVADREWLRRLVDYMRAHPGTAGVGGQIRRREDRLLSRFVDEVGHMGHKVRQGKVLVLITANACYRRRVLEEVGGFDERIPWPEGEDGDLSRRVIDQGGLLALEPAAVVGHAHRDTVRGIFKDGKLAGIGNQYRTALGLIERQPAWRTVLGMLRNHLLRTLKAPGPLLEKPAYAWLSVVKTAGLVAGIRSFRATVSAEDLAAGRLDEVVGKASTLQAGGPTKAGRRNERP